jgi:hypothetical protein
MRSAAVLATVVHAALAVTLAPTPAGAHEHVWIGSTAKNGGSLAVQYDFGRAFPTVPLPGSTGFIGVDPAFNTFPADSPGFFRPKAGTNVFMEIVAIDPAITVELNGKTLRAPGDRAKVGTIPYLHQHPQWNLRPPAGVVGNWYFSFRVTSPTEPYKPSPVYTAAVTNVPATTTTTTTPDSWTTTSTDPSVATTTTTEPPCTAAACADGDGCTDDVCVSGTCTHTDRVGFDAVDCRLARLRAGLGDTSPLKRSGARMYRQMGRLLDRTAALVGSAGGARASARTRSLDRAHKALDRFYAMAVTGAKQGKLPAEDSARLEGLATDAMDKIALAASGG